MAGSFGFEKDHYDLSIKCGERVLLPAVRSADKDTLIITDGFSCREQVAQTTGREALHLAQVIQLALYEDKGKLTGAESEDLVLVKDHAFSRLGMALSASASILLLVATLVWRWRKRKTR